VFGAWLKAGSDSLPERRGVPWWCRESPEAKVSYSSAPVRSCFFFFFCRFSFKVGLNTLPVCF